MSFTRALCVFVIVAATGIALYLRTSRDFTPGSVKTASVGVNLPRNGSAFVRLSEYNLFKDFQTQTPNAGVIPYDIATPLFTDYASKHRFVYVPDGQAAQYNPERMFEYPVGTILLKTFGYLNDIRDESQGEELIETRLLIRGIRKWTAWTYVYDAAVEDAVLEVDGASRQMTWTHFDGNERPIDYIVPALKDCRSCHNEQYNVVPIGPKAWNLNRNFVYKHGTKNQLAHWSDIGILEGLPSHEETPALPLWEDETDGTLDQRARAYLEVNCAHCHNPKGQADRTSLDLRWIQDDPYALGIGRHPEERGSDWDEDRHRQVRRRVERPRDWFGRLFAERNRDWGEGDFDVAGRVFDIVPGKPDESIMVYRMESLEPTVSMPKVPHRLVHEEGVALIREWIAAMEDVDQAPAGKDPQKRTKVDPAKLTIRAKLSGNAESFLDERGNISSRRLTRTAVKWFPQTWHPKAGRGERQRTPELSPLIRKWLSRTIGNKGMPFYSTAAVTNTGRCCMWRFIMQGYRVSE